MKTDLDRIRERNPYLYAWKTFQEPYLLFNSDFMDPGILSRFETQRQERFNAYKARHKLVDRFGFAVPTDEALFTIAKHGPIVEIGAGRGYWGMLLRKLYDVDIKLYDKFVPGPTSSNKWFKKPPFTPVLHGTESKVKQFPNCTLLMIWPYMDQMAYNCVRRYKGDTVIYVGEYEGGCTANSDFFMEMDKHWEVVQTVEIPQWDGVHDELLVYQRKGVKRSKK